MDHRWKAPEPTPTAKPLTRLLRNASEWWKALSFPKFGEHYSDSPYQWLGTALFKKAIEGGFPVRTANWSGKLLVPPDGLYDAALLITGGRVVKLRTQANNNGQVTISGDNSMIEISVSGGGMEAEVSLVTDSEEIIVKFDKLFARALSGDNPQDGLVFTLTAGMGGYSISRLGVAGTPLIRTNYAPQVLDAYDHIVGEQSSVSPCGRLIVMSGCPGSGKTFLIRSLLSDAPRTAYILVPPNLVSSLGSPEMLPALTQAKREFDGPIMLLLEDADKCLVKRGDSNIDSISAMLNLGDGILGSILDVRILATTNATALEMDEATRREGRLCRHIEVGKLTAEQATAALQAIVKKPVKPFKSATALAGVYAAARATGWMPVVKPKPTGEGKYARPELV